MEKFYRLTKKIVIKRDPTAHKSHLRLCHHKVEYIPVTVVFLRA